MDHLQPVFTFQRNTTSHIQSNSWKSANFLAYLISCLKDYLRVDEVEVNHHGRVRKIGEEGEEEVENEMEVMKNNWVGSKGQLGLDLF